MGFSINILKVELNFVGTPRTFDNVPNIGRQHFPEIASNVKHSMRCRNRNCYKKTKFFCELCNLYFCITGKRNCFKEFHSA